MTEDPIRAALVKMGCINYSRRDNPWVLPRVEGNVRPVGYWWKSCEALFIAEAKEYLKEKGYIMFGIVYDSKVVEGVVVRCWAHNNAPPHIEGHAPTEHEAWAKAVLSALEETGEEKPI